MRAPSRHILVILVILLPVALSSCAMFRSNRCYLEETRYMGMKAIFEQTGSYQRAAQAMDDEGWATCEINQFRYRLRKDLGLEGEEFEALAQQQEPNRAELDFHPGNPGGSD